LEQLHRIHEGDIIWLDMGFGAYDIRRIGIVLANRKSPIPMVAQSKWAEEIAKVKWLDSDTVEEYMSVYLVLYCREE